MNFLLNNPENYNTLMVGLPHNDDQATEHNLGGNLFFGDPASFSPKVFDYVVNRFGITSILDVGSGRGDTPRYLSEHFHIPVIGIEGLDYNIANAHYPLVKCDLTQGPYVGTPVDLVHCVEVVEHIDEKYIDNLLDTLTNGKFLLMTHALPSQTTGQYHVNEQPSSYWIEKLASRNFMLLALDTQIVRSLASKEEHGATYFALSGLLFAKVPTAQTTH